MINLLARYSAKIWGSALDLILPIQCVGCGTEGNIICAKCVTTLNQLKPPYCSICSSPNTLSPCRECREIPSSVDGIRAPYIFDGAIKQAIHAFKYRGVRAAAPSLARLLAGYLANHRMPGEIIVPVPMHPRRLRQRGYNHSALLARELGKQANLVMADFGSPSLVLKQDLLTRTRDSLPQVEAASKPLRRENVSGNFGCQVDLSGTSVIVVDDVVTTGSTLSACAQALKDAGASTVWGLALAREE